MAKFKGVKGIVNNLATSFVNSSNLSLLSYIASLPTTVIQPLEIDLLQETFNHKDLMNELVRERITFYKEWFLTEIEKLKIKVQEVDDVLIKVTLDRGKSSAIKEYGEADIIDFICVVAITIKGKKFLRKIVGAYYKDFLLQ